MAKVTLFEDINFGGEKFEINDNIAAIPPFMGSGDGQASSVVIQTNEWVVLWENVNYQEGEDQFWIAPPGIGYQWNLDNLHEYPRPHGNNHWGDRIRCVAFPGRPPSGSNENRTILQADGSITVGNPIQPDPHDHGGGPGGGHIESIRPFANKLFRDEGTGGRGLSTTTSSKIGSAASLTDLESGSIIIVIRK